MQVFQAEQGSMGSAYNAPPVPRNSNLRSTRVFSGGANNPGKYFCFVLVQGSNLCSSCVSFVIALKISGLERKNLAGAWEWL